MAVSIQDLIDKKDSIAASRKQTYDLETSIGTITVKKPSQSFVVESRGLESGGDQYLIYNMTVEPNLRDSALQKAYECAEPTDIVNKLFDAGEVSRVARAIMLCAGYSNDDIVSKVHSEAKN
jgi:hypothetical protein